MELARLRYPRIAPDATGKLRQPGIELVDVALRPPCDLTIRTDAELLQHPLEHRANPDDQLQIVRRAGTVEQRRRCVALEVDQQLAIARRLVTRIGDRAEQSMSIFSKLLRVRMLRLAHDV